MWPRVRAGCVVSQFTLLSDSPFEGIVVEQHLLLFVCVVMLLTQNQMIRSVFNNCHLKILFLFLLFLKTDSHE